MYFHKTNTDQIYLCHSLSPPVVSIVLSRVCIVTVLVYLLSRMMTHRKSQVNKLKFHYASNIMLNGRWKLHNVSKVMQHGHLKTLNTTILHILRKMEGWSLHYCTHHAKLKVEVPTCCKYHVQNAANTMRHERFYISNMLQVPCTLKMKLNFHDSEHIANAMHIEKFLFQNAATKTCKMKGCSSKMLRMQCNMISCSSKMLQIHGNSSSCLTQK